LPATNFRPSCLGKAAKISEQSELRGTGALIDYWQQSQNPRVLPTLQAAADLIWAQSWDPVDKNLITTMTIPSSLRLRRISTY